MHKKGGGQSENLPVELQKLLTKLNISFDMSACRNETHALI